MPFFSFAGNEYTRQQEGYKEVIFADARKHLAISTWKQKDVGTGKILKRTIGAIEISGNNLVPWTGRWGYDSLPHKMIKDALRDQKLKRSVESCIFDIYRSEQDSHSFEKAVGILGGKYSLLAYLFFLKDKSRYVPISTKAFDSVLPKFGVELKTASHCSWENYCAFTHFMSELKGLLTNSLKSEVSLIDAHSFAWIIASQMKREPLPKRVAQRLSLGPSERDAVIKARLGQGPFREALEKYWTTCAVTGCAKIEILEAAHIKPWRDGTDKERIDPYNGLLLLPTLHRCLDKHYITFSNDGQMIISTRLSAIDRRLLGLRKGMRLRKISVSHRPFLNRHRKSFDLEELKGTN
jgi:hypothetical protein